jgi:exopolysaccharide biosynthesis polyprenyl glycosylphosphotransferase
MLRARTLVIDGCCAVGGMMVISYLYRGLLLSRQVYLMTGVIATGNMIVVRLLLHAFEQRLARRGLIGYRVVVGGLGPRAAEFDAMIEKQGGIIKTIGFLDAGASDQPPPETFCGKPVLGRLRDVTQIHGRIPFDKLVLSAAELHPGPVADGLDAMLELVNFCEANRISLYTLPSSFDVAVTQREVASLSGIPMIRVQDAASHRTYRLIKRAIDVCAAVVGLTVGLPLWLLVALLIKLSDGGPVLFKQVRAGLHGKPFTIYKFRTMVLDAEKRLGEVVNLDDLTVPGFKIRNDPRVTAVGRILRRTSLDEFPQLINVLRGEMSLVGPRPELPELVARYTPLQRRRLKAKPGMTGYQQVCARGRPLAACVKYDLTYLKYQGLLLDAYILARTVWVVLQGKGITH